VKGHAEVGEDGYEVLPNQGVGPFGTARRDAEAERQHEHPVESPLFFSEFDRFMQEFDMVKLSRPTLRKIVVAPSDEAIKEAGRRPGPRFPRASSSQREARRHAKALSTTSALFEFNITRDSTGSTVTLVHDLGVKGSEFFGE
jgi:hypothetical protein